MSDTAIEVSMQPMNSIDVVSQSPPSIDVIQVAPLSIDVAIATMGPPGEKGDPGATVGVEIYIGNPEYDFSQLYQLSKQ